jgi:hypothetical protein
MWYVASMEVVLPIRDLAQSPGGQGAAVGEAVDVRDPDD